MRRIILSLLVIGFLAGCASAVLPGGAGTTFGTSEAYNGTAAGTAVAQGGNITALDLYGQSQTTRWQGYYGEVSGNITLADASGDKMFQWTWDSASGGEVLATETTSGVDWANLAAATLSNLNYVGGAGADNATQTFASSPGSWTIAGNVIANVNETYTYNSTGGNAFREGVMTDGTSTDEIFVTQIYDDTDDFDGTTSDFQLLVPVDETATVTYYFYLELS